MVDEDMLWGGLVRYELIEWLGSGARAPRRPQDESEGLGWEDETPEEPELVLEALARKEDV